MGLATLAATWTLTPPTLLALVIGAVLVAAVMAAVHHAEVVAARVGEPFGTLTLAIAVTVIEVALILTIMVADREGAATLARDTAFAAVMIIYNGVLGACVLVGTIKHHSQGFQPRGAAGALAAVGTLVGLALVLPSFTTTTGRPTLATSQLIFVAVVALVLYLVFVFVQTIRHRYYFLSDEAVEAEDAEADDDELDVPKPDDRTTRLSLVFLVLSLVAVVGLAKVLSDPLKSGVAAVGAPVAVVGILIALLVLAPETLAAVRAAAADKLQTSMNLAFGSAMAAIGLTIPSVAVGSLVLDIELQLGLNGVEIVLLVLTLFNAVLTVAYDRVTVMQGAIHMTLFGAFLFFAFVP